MNDKHTTRNILVGLGVAALAVCALSVAIGSRAVSDNRAPMFASAGNPHRPLVIVNGQTQQIQPTDYIQSTGGISANSTPATGSGDIEGTTETVSSQLTAGGQFITAGTLTITAWSTGQTLNDWNPTGLATANVISVQQTSGTTNITGIAAQPTGTEITIYNRETSLGSVVLEFETGSTSTNQFVLPGAAALGFNWTMMLGTSMTFRYGGSNWQLKSIGTFEFPYIQVDLGAHLGGGTTIDKLSLTTQADTSTGTVNAFVFFSTTTTLVWSGASAATFTGMIGGSEGRIAIVINASSGQTLTLANLNGGSLSQYQYQNFNGADAALVGNGSFAMYVWTNGVWQMVSSSPMRNKGTITLSSGSGTATVLSGLGCTCTDTTAANAVKCAVSSTTLTATGTGADVIQYLCF